MKAVKRYVVDALVIGSGPGGSITAHELVKAGRQVLVLEEGYERGEGVRPYSRAEAVTLYRSAGMSTTFGQAPLSFAEACCVGGGSEVNSGFYHQLPRSVLLNWKRVLDDFSEQQYLTFAREVESYLPISQSGKVESEASRRLGMGALALGWKSAAIPRWVMTRPTESGWEIERRSMSETYLREAILLGAQLRTGMRVERLWPNKYHWTVTGRSESRGEKFVIVAKWVYVSAGGTGTPAILRRSGITRGVGNTMRFHPMARLTARFADTVSNSGIGVPVRQVTEFLPGVTLGCSASDIPQLALWVGSNGAAGALRESGQFSIYYALVASEALGKLRCTPWTPGNIVFYSMSKSDRKSLQFGVMRLAEALFAAGAEEVLLPDAIGTSTRSFGEMVDLTAGHDPISNWLISTIHVYGGVPIGRDLGNPLDSWGRVRGQSHLYVNDVSMLPTSIGVNPQGPLMALALRNVRAHLDSGEI